MRRKTLSPLDRHVALLSSQPDTPAYRQLLAANWLLICLVTTYGIFALCILSRTLSLPSSINRGRCLLFATFALGLYAVGNIWFVQLVSYRLWPYVGKQEAYVYHIAWWHTIWSVLFIPAGLVLLGSLAMLWIRPDGVSRKTGEQPKLFLVLTEISLRALRDPVIESVVRTLVSSGGST